MLRYRRASDFPPMGAVRRVIVLTILCALREKADQIRFRCTEGVVALTFDAAGRRGEMPPVPGHVWADLVKEFRQHSRVVEPKPTSWLPTWLRRTVNEPAVGWFTFRFRDASVLFQIRIDPDVAHGEILLERVGRGLDPEEVTVGVEQILSRLQVERVDFESK
jgi:hypothetical protein